MPRAQIWATLSSMARRHWVLLSVLALGAVLRLAVAIAYRPALFWSDSWNYVYGAYSSAPVRFLPEKPIGYSLAVRIFDGPGHSLPLLTSIQHLAGLATGVIVYALLVHLGVRRALAALGAAVVLFDSYAFALEQHVLSEAFFTLALLGSVYLAVLAARRSRSSLSAGASGLLLAAAISIRVVAVYAIPAWLLYLAWSRVGWRAIGAAVLALAIPLLAYSTAHSVKTGQFGMLEMDGYSMYARIGQIADCSDPDVSVSAELKPLCPKSQPRSSRDPVDFYLYDPRSPALRYLGDPFTAPPERRELGNRRLREFSLEIIRGRPLAFAGLLGGEFLRLFEPGAMSTLPGYDDPIKLPERPRRIEKRFRITRDQYYPGYAPRVHPPAAVLVDYQRWLHTPRWLMGLFSLTAVVALLAGLLGRGRTEISHRREILLLVGVGLSILLGAVTAHFEPRYLVPAVPLLTGAGLLSIADLAPVARNLGRRLRPARPAERT